MKRLGYLLATVLASGCVQVETYPDAWPERASWARGRCPDISGEYGFVDVAGRLDFASERTFRILDELSGSERTSPVPHRVTIAHERDRWVRVEVFARDTTTYARELAADSATLRCERGGLFLEPPPLEQVFAGGGQTIRRSLLFNTAEDGSLVFRQRYVATSRILVIPVAGFGLTWHRLERVGP